MPPFIGILSLDTRFPRIPGDAGHPDSYHLPARLRVVPGAGSPEIVRDGRPAPELVAAFRTAAQALAADGACLITSTCGFLVTVQEEIARAVPVPVLLSGLSLLPVVARMTGARPVGILTASAPALGPAAIAAAGGRMEDVRIAGLEQDPVFAATFLAPKERQAEQLDPARMAAAAAGAARDLVARAAECGAILIECGNLPPYAGAIAAAAGRPVFSILDGARLVAPA
ncbi:aspartate/glutamate racemase family protein [Mangrovicoccus algicola]|uniref:Aspartate/glutamate racemase family protein n=1 Tax=Mangrovicoccus algicola TaxID=2771008 RepID=A0A8J7CSY0_9RHOB|nr:aspartate/glutamate racemase family protein [Mangrovicoccus algicola]MBE3636659.1 aspartate/glutamate racemase family protein [Mangrovicoccus algicola]